MNSSNTSEDFDQSNESADSMSSAASDELEANVRTLVHDALKQPGTPETYVAMATRHFQGIRDGWNTVDLTKSPEKSEELLRALTAYFIERQREPESSDNFHLKNALDSIVRQFGDLSFHKSLCEYIMRTETGDNAELVQIVQLAKEFDAVRKRRFGVHLLKREEDAKPEEGNMLINEARETFVEVLKHWEQVEDFVSQGRTVYELGQIETELGNWEEAGAWHSRSGSIAAAAGDMTGKQIGIVKANEALMHADTADFSSIEDSLSNAVAELRKFSQSGDIKAKTWVIDTVHHQAEACVKLAEVSEEASDKRMWAQKAIALCDEVLTDKDGYVAELQKDGLQVQEVVGGTKVTAMSIIDAL